MKKAIISRLLNSQSPPFLKPHYYRDRSLFAARNGRFLSTGSEKVDGSSTLEEAERVEFTPPKEKLLVLGGNGFVGSHICIEALAHGLDVSSLSRDLLSPDSLGNAMNGVTSVISCVGGFGSNSYMYDINGTANINAIRAASEQGVKRFVYISAADFGLVNYLLKGYYAGKRSTEKELLDKFLHGGVILRPGFIHGTRRVGSLHLPLSIIGAPLEMVLRHAKLLTHLPLIGPLLIPPVNVTSVAKVAVRAAVDPAFPRCVVDVYGILQHSQRNPA
uniref:NAD(P)-binding domain-containing protein n=1 Tax=Salix viminalis TaxID=40686 RepID=A0A6N2LHR8_SALVM